MANQARVYSANDTFILCSAAALQGLLANAANTGVTAVSIATEAVNLAMVAATLIEAQITYDTTTPPAPGQFKGDGNQVVNVSASGTNQIFKATT